MRTRRVLVGLVLVFAISFGLYADGGAPVGREVARDGSVEELSGDLEHREDEWFVRTEDGSFQLMLGRFGHEKNLPFAEGASAEVRGFSVSEYVAPISVATSGELEEFWHEARYPLWAGSGERRNAVTERRSERAEEAHGLALDRKPVGEREVAPAVQRREQKRSESAPARGGRR